MIVDSLLNVHRPNIRIRKAGKGPKTVFFVHGNSCSSEFWDKQLNNKDLQRQFRMIAFDLPGHGKSERLTNHYNLLEMIRFIPALIEKMGVEEYILAGLSFGTYLIAEAAPYLDHCKGFFLAAPNISNNEHPPTSYIVPFPEMYAMATPFVTDEVLDRFVNMFVVDKASDLRVKFKTSYLNTDPAFRTALGETIAKGEWTNEFLNIENAKLPTYFIFGKEDKLLRIDYLDFLLPKPNIKIFKIDNAAHFINDDQPALFNELLIEFSKRAFE